MSNRRGIAITAACLTALLVAGCGATRVPSAKATLPSTKPSPTVLKRPKPDPIAVQQALLDTRAEGIRTHNLALFLSADDPTQTAFIARDRAYFAAVSALRWKVFEYQVTATPWPQQLIDPAWGHGARLPEVVFNTQLAGFDELPVSRTTGFAFVTRKGATYIASDKTIHDHLFPGYQPDPWDAGAVTVVQTPTVIGIFDPTSAQKSVAIMTMIRNAVAGVSADIPYAWDRRVVLYAMTGSTFSSAFTAAAGGDVTHLGALTYPMDPSQPYKDRRVLLLKDALQGEGGPLAQIIRHEVTHVAVGVRGDRVPLWLVEGIAEYEGAKAIPAGQRQLAESAVQRASKKPSGMPASATFHNADQDWNYALAWMACEYIVRHGGEPLLWTLLDAMNNSGTGTPDIEQDVILQEILGMNSAQLAVHAAELIRSTYG